MKYYDYLRIIKNLDKQSEIELFTPIIQRKWDLAQIEDFSFVTSGRINSVYRIILRNAPVKSVILKVRYMNDPRYKQGFACEEWVNKLLENKRFRYYSSNICL